MKSELRAYSRMMRKNGVELVNKKVSRRLPEVHETINRRSDLSNSLKALVKDGMITACASGMDCDCTSYNQRSTRKAMTVVGEDRGMQKSYEYADGPMDLWFEAPGGEDFSESKDLALAAFEDGHPHVVYR